MEQRQRWDPSNGWQHVLVAGALVLPTLSALTGSGHDAGGIAMRLGLIAALAGWYTYWVLIRRDAGSVNLPYLIGAAVLWAVMAAVDPAMLAVGVAAVIPYCLSRVLWAVVLFVGMAAAWLGQRLVSGAGLTWPSVLTCLLGVLTAVALAGYIASLHREGRRRQRLLDELATAQAELAAAERLTGILAERHRLARDIHDTLTQGFAGIAVQLDAARDDLPPSSPATRRVQTALRIARENLVESRRVIASLRPAPLDDGRLPHAVRQLSARLTEETGLLAHTVVTGDPVQLGDAVETQLLRVVQEALTNVRRHAAATEVTITLSYVDKLVAIDVQDDGTGIANGAPPSGVGLATMRERVDGLGGTLTVESAPGEGTTIALVVPLAAK